MPGIVYCLQDLPDDKPSGSFARSKIKMEVALQLAAERLGSLSAVAKTLGVSRGVLYNWMGKTREASKRPHRPSRETLERLARIINVSVEMLF